nr:hypothetical protein CFP56_63473 [Quercus suber]
MPSTLIPAFLVCSKDTLAAFGSPGQHRAQKAGRHARYDRSSSSPAFHRSPRSRSHTGPVGQSDDRGCTRARRANGGPGLLDLLEGENCGGTPSREFGVFIRGRLGAWVGHDKNTNRLLALSRLVSRREFCLAGFGFVLTASTLSNLVSYLSSHARWTRTCPTQLFPRFSSMMTCLVGLVTV